MARLDRLGPAKELAQVGAAIGREFSHTLLASVVRKPEAELRSALDRLVAAGLLFRQGVPPNATYLFKHALVQDAAYGTLLREPRRVLHARIAKTLDENFAETRDTQPEILAYHYAQAGKSALAIEWWNRAGERAMLRSAYNEAIMDLERAIGLAETLPEAPARQLLQLQANYAFALLHGRGAASPQATTAFTRARDLADQVENASEKFSAYYGMWSSSFIRSDLEPALKVAQTFVNDTSNRPDSPEAGVARRILGTTCWARGDYVEAKQQLEQALAVTDSDWRNDNRIVQRFGYDFRGGLGPMLYLGFVIWPVGEFERALLLIEQGIALAHQSRHRATIAVSRCYACLLAAIRGKPAEAAPQAQAAVALTGEHGLPYWFALSTAFLGRSRIGISNLKRANEIRQGIALLRDQGLVK
jgi:tetratricopeptide (TPR) repeat protein